MTPQKIIKNQYFFFLWLILGIASYHFWDRAAATWVQNHLDGHVQNMISYICLPGKALYPLVVLVLLFILFQWIWKKPKLAWSMLYLIAAIVISGVICDLLKGIFGRSRPGLLFQHAYFGFYWFKFKASYWSFPSGHATTSAALGMGLAMIWPRLSWLFVVLALLVAASRVLVGAHFPSDVMAGFYLGSITSILLYPKFSRKNHGR